MSKSANFCDGKKGENEKMNSKEKKRIIQALQVLKEVCSKYENCRDCPCRSRDNYNLGDTGSSCALLSCTPESYQIIDLKEEETWHAFKNSSRGKDGNEGEE